MSNYKSVNGLMKHLRNKGLDIQGSRQKKLLAQDGYYHGYKGYRFYRDKTNIISYNSYDEMNAVINYDQEIKAAIYPEIMFIETAFKNLSLEIILEHANSEKFNIIYEKLVHNREKNTAHKLRQRNNIYEKLLKAYKHSAIVKHFYNRDHFVPIWGIFEIITFGDFGNFISILNVDCKREISTKLGLQIRTNSSGKLFEEIVFTLYDLRNSVAHNGVVFDCRFSKNQYRNSIKDCLKVHTKIQNIEMTSIYDYAFLIVFLLKLLQVPQTKVNQFIKKIENAKNGLEKRISNTKGDKSRTKIIQKIIETNTNNRIRQMKNMRLN